MEKNNKKCEKYWAIFANGYFVWFIVIVIIPLSIIIQMFNKLYGIISLFVLIVFFILFNLKDKGLFLSKICFKCIYPILDIFKYDDIKDCFKEKNYNNYYDFYKKYLNEVRKLSYAQKIELKKYIFSKTNDTGILDFIKLLKQGDYKNNYEVINNSDKDI